MRLSDIMSALRLSAYAEIALVLFLLAFVAITLHVFRRKNAAEWELARHLPLDDAERPSGAEPLPRTTQSS